MTSPLHDSVPLVSDADVSGRQMRNEIAEQADVLSRLVSRYDLDVGRIRTLIPAQLAGVTFIARGSSRNAAMLGRYLVERAAHRPAALAAPALHTLYDSRVDHHGYLAIALSQSGATPEITTVLAAMARTGARTIAITNDPSSPLARVPDLVYPLDAGDELAVPATKTVTAQMLAVTVIASVFGTADASESDLYALPELVLRVLDSSDAAVRLAAAWAPSTTRVVVVSRGYGYAAALEAALKITEATGVHAQAFSAADLRHGPIASVNSNTPVLIIDTSGPGAHDLAALAALARARGAPVAWCSSSPDADLPLPACAAESLSAILATVQAQQLALSLALARGVDPDAPPGLTKVTETH